MTTTVPAGRWTADPIHSSIGFGIKHQAVTFRSSFGEYEIALDGGVLEGTVQVGSIDIALDPFKQHLLSPEYFDTERTPTLTFKSTSIQPGDDGSVAVTGELTIKGNTRTVTATGIIDGPFTNAAGGTGLGIELETTIDRNDFGLDAKMELPGGRKVIGDEVKITAALELNAVEES